MSRLQAWRNKFAVAISGVVYSVRHQNSFLVHVPLSIAVLLLGAALRIDAWRWAAVMIAITMVVCAELLNTSIEQLVKALHPDHDDRIGRALDAAAGAVLVASVGAVSIGLIALGLPLWDAVRALF